MLYVSRVGETIIGDDRRRLSVFDRLKAQYLCTREMNFEKINFHPVMHLPSDVVVFDFSTSYDPNRTLESPYGIGKYDEYRPTMYTEEQFAHTERNIHMGVDLAAPVGTAVYTFYEGSVHAMGVNPLPQDYGPTIITKHQINTVVLYALYGHLSTESLRQVSVGQTLTAGSLLGWVGGQHENGGWNPHLHFQLSRLEPDGHDLPGAVSTQDREWANRAFPDPRLVLGPIY